MLHFACFYYAHTYTQITPVVLRTGGKTRPRPIVPKGDQNAVMTDDRGEAKARRNSFVVR